MGITPSLIYLISTLDAVIGVCLFVMVVSFFLSLALGIWFCVEKSEAAVDDETISHIIRACKVLLVVFVVSLLTFTFTPSTKVAAAMYALPRIANNEKLSEIGGQLGNIAMEWLDSLKPKQATKGDGQ